VKYCKQFSLDLTKMHQKEIHHLIKMYSEVEHYMFVSWLTTFIFFTIENGTPVQKSLLLKFMSCSFKTVFIERLIFLA
jgi:hypothetical protein